MKKVLSRPTFEQIYMQLAVALGKRSTCDRKQVGCVITSVDFEHVYGVGYNGNAPSEPNCCDNTTPGHCGCEHAESNALLKVVVSSNEPKVLFTTLSPCLSCAKKLLIKKGIQKIYYLDLYRDSAGLELLSKHGIQTFKVEINEKESEK